MNKDKTKKKVLAHSDSALCGSGFGVVSKHILGAIHATGDYLVHHLAINHHGDFADKNEIPWQQQPARLLNPKDPHGIEMFMRTLSKQKYDIVWICNDLFVTREVVKPLKQFLSQVPNPPTFIYYYPIDCHAYGGEFLELVDIPVCYTHHGREETLKLYPDLKERLCQIPHGVDNKVFKPLSKDKIIDGKRRYLNVDPDTTVVVTVNRNSTRKQIPYSILAFREFKKHIPNSVMYVHAAVRDQGGDLLRAIEDLGLDSRKDIIFPLNFSPSQPAPPPVLNELYNLGDIFLTTHLGEGFGLPQIEAMATGVPVVAPKNTCVPQLLGKNSERGYMYECKDQIYIDNSGWRKKGLIPDIVEQMLKVHKDGPKQDNPIVQKARKWAGEHDWKKVTESWVELFKIAEKRSRQPKTSSGIAITEI